VADTPAPTTLSKEPKPPASGPLAGLEAWLYDMLVAKAPFQLPKGLTDFLVQYGPWLILIGAVLSVPAALTLLGLGGTLYSTWGAYAGVNTSMLWLPAMALIAQLVVMFAAVPMLLKRKRSGWQLLFYAELVYVAYAVLNVIVAPYNLFGSLIGSAIGLVIGLYILFQIRSYYTN